MCVSHLYYIGHLYWAGLQVDREAERVAAAVDAIEQGASEAAFEADCEADLEAELEKVMVVVGVLLEAGVRVAEVWVVVETAVAVGLDPGRPPLDTLGSARCTISLSHSSFDTRGQSCCLLLGMGLHNRSRSSWHLTDPCISLWSCPRSTEGQLLTTRL